MYKIRSFVTPNVVDLSIYLITYVVTKNCVTVDLWMIVHFHCSACVVTLASMPFEAFMMISSFVGSFSAAVVSSFNGSIGINCGLITAGLYSSSSKLGTFIDSDETSRVFCRNIEYGTNLTCNATSQTLATSKSVCVVALP